MASYNTLGSYTTVQVLSPSNVLDVEMVSFQTLPTGIFAEYPVPLTTWQQPGGAPAADALLTNVANAIESVVPNNGVVGGTFVQDVDPATQLLTDYIQYFLSHTNATTGAGPFTTAVNVPVTLIVAGPGASTGIGGFIIPTTQQYTQTADQVVNQAYQNLVALAGG